ncbi:hypothetical protein ACNF49_21680 [Actinomadura sp. ATCC 39365]|uniref:hypothetical protein n=1 Tax=Nonomuraea sp. NPDC005692 TaxID=3157168 RepID=UPI0033C3D0B6
MSAADKEAFSRVLAAEPAPGNVRVIGIRPHAVVDAPAAGAMTGAIANLSGGAIVD